MKTLTVLIIEHAEGRAQGIEDMVSGASTLPKNIIVRRVYKEDINTPIDSVDAIILSGGPMSVNEIDRPEYEYIRKELVYLDQAIENRVPILGICLGHQLTAHLFGGTIATDPSMEEIGWFDISQSDDGMSSMLFKNVPKSFTVFQYHNDCVVSPPEGTKLLASSERCSIQSLEYINKPIFTVQFHPEINGEQGNVILESQRQKLEKRGYDVDTLKQRSRLISNDARKQIFENFIAYCCDSPRKDVK